MKPALPSTDRQRAFVNKNFVICVTDRTADYAFLRSRGKDQPKRRDFLVGAGKYAALVGEGLKEKHFRRVATGGAQKYTFKLRDKLTANFRSK